MRSPNSQQTIPLHNESVMLLLFVAGCLIGCAGPRAYVPFEQHTKLSTEARWQAVQTLAERERWKVAESNQTSHMILGYRYSETSGMRDRIKIALFPDRTVVETVSEIEDQGRWESSMDRCEKYGFSREKALAAQIEQVASQSEPLVSSVAEAGPGSAPSTTSVAMEVVAQK